MAPTRVLTLDEPDPQIRPVEHQLQIAKLADGERVDKLLEKQEPERATAMLRQIGEAIAMFHKQYRVGEPSAEQGFKTIVHGDFWGANMFFDGESNKLTLVDLAPMGQSVQHDGGMNMLLDVARMLNKLNPEAKDFSVLNDQQKAFIEGYCDGLADLFDENGSRIYTPKRIQELATDQAVRDNSYLG